jgi:4-hydroxybenzoate polyprenyltransferase
MRRDFSAGLIPGILFVVAAWNSTSGQLAALPLVLLKGVIYFWFYLYSFCLANQLVGFEEDQINKPDRLLVQGVISLRYTYWRWAAVMISYTLVAWWLGVVVWALLWQAITLLYNFYGWDKRWYLKDWCMALGAVAQFAAAWQLVAPITALAWYWILLIAASVLLAACLQDLRDVVGDRAQQRRTAPIVIGEPWIRYLLVTWFILFPIIIWFAIVQSAASPLAAQIVFGIHTVVCLLIAGRLLWMPATPSNDHRTYMIYTYWYCALPASAIILV